MAYGFIRDTINERLLILYILDKLILPVTMSELTDLAMCDGGMNYFRFTEGLAGLVENGQVVEDGDKRYAITAAGRHNCAECVTELPKSVRNRCDGNTRALNQILKRRSQIHSAVRPDPDPKRAGCRVELALDDEAGNMMTLTLAAPDETQAKLLADRFRERAEQVYQAILTTLLE
jgi:hypothetical protein